MCVCVCVCCSSLEADIESRLVSAKEDLQVASLKLRAMIRAFKESQLYATPPSGGGSDAGEQTPL